MAKSKYTDQEIFDKVLEITQAVVPKFNADGITMASGITKDMNLDSLNFVMIICKIEAFYGIKFDDKKWQKLQTGQELVDEIQRLLAKKK